jgi:DNA-binding XRE family transcriptional regulator
VTVASAKRVSLTCPPATGSSPRSSAAASRSCQDVGLTQQAVAAHIGVAQQTLAHYKVGRLRLPVVLVPKLAQFFGEPTDVLLGATGAQPGKRGPTPKLQRQLERLSRLPKAQK